METREKWSDETKDDHLDLLYNYPEAVALPTFASILILYAPIPIIVHCIILILASTFTICPVKIISYFTDILQNYCINKMNLQAMQTYMCIQIWPIECYESPF